MTHKPLYNQVIVPPGVGVYGGVGKTTTPDELEGWNVDYDTSDVPPEFLEPTPAADQTPQQLE